MVRNLNFVDPYFLPLLPHPQLSPSLPPPSNTVIFLILISLSFARYLLPQPSSSAPPPELPLPPHPISAAAKTWSLGGKGRKKKKKKTLGCGTVKPGMLSRQGRFFGLE